jgi:hypothetical protein
MEVRPLAERADARKLDVERLAAQGRQLGVQVAGDVFADVAEEAQGDVQRLQRPPTCALDAGLAAGKRVADLVGDRYSGEEPDHGFT